MRRRSFTSPLLVVLLLALQSAPVFAADGDVSGRWLGTWNGVGIFHIPRQEPVLAELRQEGAAGEGRLVFDGAVAAESVPLILRLAGAAGVPVTFTETSTGLVMRETDDAFTIDFVRRGDDLVGRVRDTDPGVTLVLRRELPAAEPPGAAAAPVPGPVARLAPAPAEPPEPATAPPQPVPPPPSAAERPPVGAFVDSTALASIHFDFDEATIRPDAAAILDANAAWLRAHADVDVLIEGHCDERGTEAYNLALGERRARAAREYLIAHGIPATKLTTISYGEERPVCTERNEACWSQNRRAVFRASSD